MIYCVQLSLGAENSKTIIDDMKMKIEDAFRNGFNIISFSLVYLNFCGGAAGKFFDTPENF